MVQQRGIVLVFALITLVIMMIGAVAISRSLTAGQFTIGNLGFKRDLTNQGERALQVAMDLVRNAGVLADPAARNADMKAANYKASLLPTNAQGIPTALLSDVEFANVGNSANDIKVDDMGVVIRYVIDRLSTNAGNCSPDTCVMANQNVFGGGSSEWINSQTNSGAVNSPNPSAVPQQPIYRISLKVTGPRKTQSFFQSTFTTN
jgi:type IV pilus assembly protein PilX